MMISYLNMSKTTYLLAHAPSHATSWGRSTGSKSFELCALYATMKTYDDPENGNFIINFYALYLLYQIVSLFSLLYILKIIAIIFICDAIFVYVL